jgi:hypothetical protein
VIHPARTDALSLRDVSVRVEPSALAASSRLNRPPAETDASLAATDREELVVCDMTIVQVY